MKLTGRVSKAEARDTGMALTLLLLLLNWLFDWSGLLLPALLTLLVAMTAPGLFRPAAIVWLGLARLLSAVSSRLILTVVYSLVITPIGLLRRALGADPLRVRQWKQGRDSVFTTRSGEGSASEIEQPF